MNNIILLDIDDTILPTILSSDNKSIGDIGNIEDSLGTLTINCRRLARVCEIYDLQIRIISSWSNGVIFFDEKGLNYILHTCVNKPYYNYEKNAFDIIHKYLNKYIIGISCGNKSKDIKMAIQDKSIKNVIVIEDTDFSSNCNVNNRSFYIKSEGYISNRMIVKIINIINNE